MHPVLPMGPFSDSSTGHRASHPHPPGDHREIRRCGALHRFGHRGALGRRILGLLLLLGEALVPGHFGLRAQLAVLVLAAKKARLYGGGFQFIWLPQMDGL